MNNSDAQANPRKLFVGNLPYSATEDQLNDLFAPHGEIVEIKLIIDRMSGRSKGIAFVEYVNEADAQKAIDAVNGTELEGRALIVNVARPFQPRERTGGFGGGNRGGFGGGQRSGGYRGGNDRGGYNSNRGGY
jgi:cold-inducible RNA-binding protein